MVLCLAAAGQQWEIPGAGVGRRCQDHVPHPVEARGETGLPQGRGRRDLQGQDVFHVSKLRDGNLTTLHNPNTGYVTVTWNLFDNLSASSSGLGRVQREADRRGTGKPGLLEDPSALRPQQESGVQGGERPSPAGHLGALQGVPPRPHQRAGWDSDSFTPQSTRHTLLESSNVFKH